MTKYSVICSSSTKEGLEKLINEFFYSTSWYLDEDNQLRNKDPSRPIPPLLIRIRRGRFQALREARP